MGETNLIFLAAYKREKRKQSHKYSNENEYLVTFPLGMGGTFEQPVYSSKSAFMLVKELHDDGQKDISVFHKGARIFPPLTGVDGIQVV